MKTFPKFVLGPFIFVIIFFTGMALTSLPVSADAIKDLLGSSSEKIEESPATKIITTDNTNISDKKIRKRLGDIFAELESLNKLQIATNKGVVTLTGEVASVSIQEKASSLAKKV